MRGDGSFGRRDLLKATLGLGDPYGFNDGNAAPERADPETGIAALAPLLAKAPVQS